MLLASEKLFQRAYEEGVLEQAWVSGQSTYMMVMATLSVHMVSLLLPLILICPFAGFMFHFNGHEIFILMGSLLLGAPALFSLSALAAAFNVGHVQRTTLMTLIILPLTLPVMIFGAAVIHVAEIHAAVMGLYALLTAMSLISFVGLSFAIVGVIRLRFQE